MIRAKLVAVCALALFAASAAYAGVDLDEILNYMRLDQSTPMLAQGELFKADRTISLTKDSPIGQTFVTTADTDRIVRIRTRIGPDRDWQRGEGVELVLWDSSEKKVACGRYTIWYEYRGFQHARPEFEINARVLPDRTYYFEMSYVGEGDGKLSKVAVLKGADGYASGQGYLAGQQDDFDVCFQTHIKPPPDQAGNLRKMFDRFELERPELAQVKQAVEAGEFEEAISRTVAYFEKRKDPVAIIDPKQVPGYNPDFDTTQGDLAMHNYFASSEIGEGYAGPDINWRAEPHFYEDGTIADSYWNTGLNRYGPRGPLGGAYSNTGNEKYAKKLNDVLIDWYLDNPPPAVSQLGGPGMDPVWATLDAGIRLGHGFAAYSRLHKSPFFTLDGRMAYLLHLADNADTLVLNGEGDGGNWAFTQNAAMLEFGLNFPEFRNARTWRDTASRRLAAAIKKDILPDGVEMESAPGYQRMSYKPLVSVYNLIRDRGVETPFGGELKDILEKQAEYFMYLAAPNGITPCLGDWGNTSERGALQNDSELLGRSDMLYVATAGKQGARPMELSRLYPYAGIVTMRSHWGDTGESYEDSRYLMLHGVHHGAHGHADLNSVTLYAYGRELLADPGMHDYGPPDHLLLARSSSHNLVTVDGRNQKRRTDATFDNWATTPVADYIDSSTSGYEGFDYNREVFFVRANNDPGAQEYWVVRDTVEGEGTHSLEQRWHFTLGQIKLDTESGTVRTLFDEGGNLGIMQVQPARLKAEQTTIDTQTPRGSGSEPNEMPTVIYTADAALPAAIETVLFPFEGKQMPEVRITSLEKSPNGLDSAFKIVQGEIIDLFVFRTSVAPTASFSGGVTFDGDRLFLRRVAGKLRAVLLVNGTSVAISGKDAVKSDKPLSWIAVLFDPDKVNVYTPSAAAKISVPAAEGRKIIITDTGSDALIGATRQEEQN